MKVIDKTTLYYAIIVLIVITIFTSMSKSIVTSILAGLLISVSLIVTNFLFNIDRKQTDALLVLIGSAAISLYFFILNGYISVIQVVLITALVIMLFNLSRYKGKKR